MASSRWMIFDTTSRLRTCRAVNTYRAVSGRVHTVAKQATAAAATTTAQLKTQQPHSNNQKSMVRQGFDVLLTGQAAGAHVMHMHTSCTCTRTTHLPGQGAPAVSQVSASAGL